jgi:hypothetical protein
VTCARDKGPLSPQGRSFFLFQFINKKNVNITWQVTTTTPGPIIHRQVKGDGYSQRFTYPSVATVPPLAIGTSAHPDHLVLDRMAGLELRDQLGDDLDSTLKKAHAHRSSNTDPGLLFLQPISKWLTQQRPILVVRILDYVIHPLFCTFLRLGRADRATRNYYYGILISTRRAIGAHQMQNSSEVSLRNARISTGQEDDYRVVESDNGTKEERPSMNPTSFWILEAVVASRSPWAIGLRDLDFARLNRQTGMASQHRPSQQAIELAENNDAAYST